MFVPESKRVAVGKEVIKSVKRYIEEGKDFSIETTLAGKNAIRQIQKAKEIGEHSLGLFAFLVVLNES